MDYFAKKQWIRIAICAVLVAAIVLAMTGVFSGTESLKYDPSAKKLAAGESEAEAAMQGFEFFRPDTGIHPQTEHHCFKTGICWTDYILFFQNRISGQDSVNIAVHVPGICAAKIMKAILTVNQTCHGCCGESQSQIRDLTPVTDIMYTFISISGKI